MYSGYIGLSRGMIEKSTLRLIGGKKLPPENGFFFPGEGGAGGVLGEQTRDRLVHAHVTKFSHPQTPTPILGVIL